MQKEDARKQSREVLHERRKQVVRMHRKGVGVMQIVEQTGLSWTAVNTALRLHSAGSAATLKPGIRGKQPGSGRSLTPEQEQSIRCFDFFGQCLRYVHSRSTERSIARRSSR